MLYWEDLEFPSGVGLVTNHSMSTTTYCQPNDLRCSANHCTFALKSASVTVVPKESQLFQPIGGVGAEDSPPAGAPPFTLECRGIADEYMTRTDSARSETRSSILNFMSCPLLHAHKKERVSLEPKVLHGLLTGRESNPL